MHDTYFVESEDQELWTDCLKEASQFHWQHPNSTGIYLGDGSGKSVDSNGLCLSCNYRINKCNPVLKEAIADENPAKTPQNMVWN